MKQSNGHAAVEKDLYIFGWGIPIILCLAAVCLPYIKPFLEPFYVPCVFHSLTGYYCPGCGGTRAAVAFINGKFIASFLYHPIVVYTAGIYGWFMLSHTIALLSRGKLAIGMRYRNVYLWLALAILIVNAAVKNMVLLVFRIDILRVADTFSR